MNSITSGRKDRTNLAVLAIILTVLFLSLGDALIKLVSVHFPLWQVFVCRSLIALPILISLLKLQNRLAKLTPQSVKWTAVRSLMLVFMWIAYYAALPHLDLSSAAAVYYTLPLFIILFSAFFIGEKIRKLGWVAVVTGFGGVLLILQPQADSFNLYALLPLSSAILYALAMIITRTKCQNENPVVLSLGLNVAFIFIGVLATTVTLIWSPSYSELLAYPYLLGHWVVLGVSELATMAVLAAIVIIGSVGAAFAYQSGPPSIVSIFDFSYLPFAAMWGLLIFDEIPNETAVIGIVLIVFSGILATRQRP